MRRTLEEHEKFFLTEVCVSFCQHMRLNRFLYIFFATHKHNIHPFLWTIYRFFLWCLFKALAVENLYIYIYIYYYVSSFLIHMGQYHSSSHPTTHHIFSIYVHIFVYLTICTFLCVQRSTNSSKYFISKSFNFFFLVITIVVYICHVVMTFHNHDMINTKC